MTEIYKYIIENSGKNTFLFIALIALFSLIYKYLINIPVWEFVFYKSRQKKQSLVDSIESFNLIEEKINNEELISILRKELNHKLISKYLKVKVQSKKMEELISLYTNNNEINSTIETSDFFKFHSDYINNGKGKPYFTNRVSLIYIIIGALTSSFYFGMYIFNNINQSDIVDTFVILFVFMLPVIFSSIKYREYSIKQKLNKCIEEQE